MHHGITNINYNDHETNNAYKGIYIYVHIYAYICIICLMAGDISYTMVPTSGC